MLWWKRTLLAVGVLIALGLLAMTAEAQGDAGGENGDVALPPIVADLLVGGVAVGPIIMGIVQVAKKLGLPDGTAGWLALGLSVAAVVLATLAGWFDIGAQVGQGLTALDQVVRAVSAFAGMFGGSLAWHKTFRTAQIT